MAKPKGGLNKWFKEKWVDISKPKKGGGYAPCGRPSARKSKRKYPKCVPAAKAARMTKAQARRRLLEAKAKVDKVMLAGHITTKAAVPVSEKLNAMAMRIK